MNSKFKLLVVCSQNQWRSPTAEAIYKNDPRFYIRSAGTSPTAKHVISTKDIDWADLIVCMEKDHKERIKGLFPNIKLPPIKVLRIEDKYEFMDPGLVEILKERVEQAVNDSLQAKDTGL